MKRLAAILCTALCLVGLAAVAARKPPKEVRETVYVFGTLVEIVVHSDDEAKARAAAGSVAAMLQDIHRDWHAWRPGALEEANAAFASGEPVVLDTRLVDVLRLGRTLSCDSGGLFEPALGGLIALWGFHADTLPIRPPPAPAEIQAIMSARPRMMDLMINGTTARSANPAVQLDLGGYAKGAALDLAAAQLQELGIAHAVLNAGGDVNVIGRHRARPWRVAIRDPFVWGVVGAISMQPGEVLYTSGNYERYLEHGGERFSHIIDPRSGMPVRDIVSVSVLGRDGARADAAATALSVAGAEGWPKVAAAMGVKAVLVITDEGRMLATPAMRARLEPVSGGFPAAIETVSLPEIGPPPVCD